MRSNRQKDVSRPTVEQILSWMNLFPARIAVRTGRHPDFFAEQNDWTKSTYARLIHDLCGLCITDGTFDTGKARRLTTTEQGKNYLKNAVAEFAWIERNYNSWGRTGLEALKDLLKCFYMT